MHPYHNESHWIYKIAGITRISWFIFHLLVVALFLNTTPFFWLLLTLLFAAFLIPQWSGKKIIHYPVLELILSGLFLIVGCALAGKYSSFFALPALCAGLYCQPGKVRWIMWVCFSTIPFLAYVVIGINEMGMGVIDGLFFFGVGVVIANVIDTEVKMKILLEENHRQNHLLEEYAKQVEKVTLLEERNRLSRDLHDTVGHTFTSVIMGLDAVSYLMDASPEKAKEQIERLGEVMRRSLDEIRNYIHQISPISEEKETLSDQLKKVADGFALHTKTKITFNRLGTQAELSFQGTVTLIRCLQESLTNAVRHGRATDITITLNQQNDQVLLSVQDNGFGMNEIIHGFGMNGMRERLESLQGGLAVESQCGSGTVVTCVLPIRRSVLYDQSVNCG